MLIKSSAFKEGAIIPARFSCDNLDVSPPLEWSMVPPDTKTFAIVCDDPDAAGRTWVHWVLFNLPGALREVPENMPLMETLKNGTQQGVNDFGNTGYGGPCPPSGTHRYYFRLYALDTELSSNSGNTKKDLLKAMEGHILEEVHLMGRYKR